MENQYNTPQQIVETNLKVSEAKAKMPISKLLVAGVMAGAAIAFGGLSSNVVVHAIANAGCAKFIAGASFPVGLMRGVML